MGGTYCRHCGAMLSEGAKFCNKCGATIVPPPPNIDAILLEAKGQFGQKLQLLPTKIRIVRKGIQQFAVQGLKGNK